MVKKCGPWALLREKQKGVERFVVKRWTEIDGKRGTERLPAAKYKFIRNNEPELIQFVRRLNAPRLEEERAKRAVKFKHAFIDQALLDEYREVLLARNPSKDRAVTGYHYLEEHFLNFFIGKLNLSDPLDWFKVHGSKWASYLIEHADIAAPSTKREVVQVANKFVKWLHMRRPGEMPMLKFEPLSTAVLKDLEAKRKQNPDVKRRDGIPPADWTRIQKNLPPNLKPFALLAYHYGLRRSEALALSPDNVMTSHLNVERQLVRLLPTMEYTPTKGDDNRKVPHWFCKPVNAADWIDKAQAFLVHPDTLTERWSAFVEGLYSSKDPSTRISKKYDFHDIRHTWATRAGALGKPIDEVRLAAGHKHLTTTQRYMHDARGLVDVPFVRRKKTA